MAHPEGRGPFQQEQLGTTGEELETGLKQGRAVRHANVNVYLSEAKSMIYKLKISINESGTYLCDSCWKLDDRV